MYSWTSSFLIPGVLSSFLKKHCTESRELLFVPETREIEGKGRETERENKCKNLKDSMRIEIQNIRGLICAIGMAFSLQFNYATVPCKYTSEKGIELEDGNSLH
jgi:hypothetical protein